MEHIGLIDYITQDFPSDSKANPFDHITQKCMDFYKADLGSYLAPNFTEEKWQLKTRKSLDVIDKEVSIPEVKLETGFDSKKEEYNEPEIWSKIEAGICNVALCKKESVFIEDVNNTQYHYVKQSDKVKSEIAIPLIREYDDEKQVFGCIVLDFFDTQKYKDAESNIEKEGHKNIEKGLVDLIDTKIYRKVLKKWDNTILEISRLHKIDFDNKAETDNLSKHISELFPKIIYYSVWLGTTDKIMDDKGKTFVRINSFFADPDTNEKYKECNLDDYWFSENDDNTYGKLIKGFIENYKPDKYDNFQREEISSKDHKPIHDQFKIFLYKKEDTILDLRFIPLIEKVIRDGKEAHIISSIFVYFFEDWGDPQIINPEKLEQLSGYIYDGIRFNRYIKARELQNKIQSDSALIFDNFNNFIKSLEKALLEALPSQAIDIWVVKNRKIEGYFLLKDDDSSFRISDIEEDKKNHIINVCLENNALSKSCHRNNNDEPFHNKCYQCADITKNHKSCMVIKVLGPKGRLRAILFFINRIIPPLNKVQAFSILDINAITDISKLLGTLFSLYETREEEQKLKTILPHEFAAPVSSLSHKLKNIEKSVSDISSFIPEKYSHKQELFKKRIFDCWLACESILYNSENYIRFIKNDTKIYPESFNVDEMLSHIMHLFSQKYKESKQIYILVEGLSGKQKQNLTCDKSMLFSTIHNIFDNAYKYSHRYTIFHIKVQENQEDIIFSFINYGGIGIEKDELKSVFEMYYQSKNIEKQAEYEVRRSHGIGLALAKWYMENCHHAKIYFNPSKRIAYYNPFFLYIIKKIYGEKKIYCNIYKDNINMLDAQVPEEIISLFTNDIEQFFKEVRPLGSLNEFLFKHMLETETFKNELILSIPKKIRG